VRVEPAAAPNEGTTLRGGFREIASRASGVPTGGTTGADAAADAAAGGLSPGGGRTTCWRGRFGGRW